MIMKNLYAIECALFPKNKIIEILKFNDFHFFPDNPKPNGGFGGYISFNEDKMWFVKKVIILNFGKFKIIIGCTFREDTNNSAFQIYFPNQNINIGFNYNPEFSKTLIAINDFGSHPGNSIISVNLHKKNIGKLNENDITFENVLTRNSKKFKPVNLTKVKSDGIEKLFLYRYQDFFLVIGWILQGKKNRNKVVYNKSFTEFLMSINPIDLKIPEKIAPRLNKKDVASIKEKTHTKNDNLEVKNNSWIDKTKNIDRINAILEKISKLGIDSLTNNELAFLNNNSGDV